MNVETAIGELAVGEALVSLLDEKGIPQPVERAMIVPPESRLGPTDAAHRQQIIKNSVLYGHYEKAVDRESAYETLKARAGQALQSAPPQQAPAQTTQSTPAESGGGWLGQLGQTIFVGTGRRESVAEAMAKSAVRAVGSSVGRQIVRGVLGSILGGSTSRRRY